MENTASAKSFGRNVGGQIFATVGIKSNLNPQQAIETNTPYKAMHIDQNSHVFSTRSIDQRSNASFYNAVGKRKTSALI